MSRDCGYCGLPLDDRRSDARCQRGVDCVVAGRLRSISPQREGDLDVDFCTALQVNERQGLATLLAPVLRALPVDDRDAAFESLRDWLAGHDCAADVEVVPGMLRSEPPIKEFVVTLKGSDPPAYRSIGVRVTRSGYVFDIK